MGEAWGPLGRCGPLNKPPSGAQGDLRVQEGPGRQGSENLVRPEDLSPPASYPCRPGFPVLRDFSLTLPPGKIVALVGQSGGGKRGPPPPPPSATPPPGTTQCGRRGPALPEYALETHAPLPSPTPRKDHRGLSARALLRPHGGHGDTGWAGPAHPRPFLAPGPGHRLHQPGEACFSVLRPSRGWGQVGCLHWSWCSFTRVPTAAALPLDFVPQLKRSHGAALLGSLTARGIQKVKL